MNDKAISPVVGVIIVVAITVILAAVIAAFVFVMSGNSNKTSQASCCGCIQQPICCDGIQTKTSVIHLVPAKSTVGNYIVDSDGIVYDWRGWTWVYDQYDWHNVTFEYDTCNLVHGRYTILRVVRDNFCGSCCNCGCCQC